MASGANLAESAGFKAEGLAVADDITVERTLVRLADERGAAVIVVGTHGHHALHEVLLGSTAPGSSGTRAPSGQVNKPQRTETKWSLIMGR